MITLENTKPLPENAQWAYLYAIADVYSRFSFEWYSSKYSLLDPHPLKDFEVVEILKEKYNLPNVHRNTISNVRKNLEEYFGFKFGINKKGRYLLNNRNTRNTETNNSISDSLIMASFLIANSSLLSKDKEMEILDALSFVAKDDETKDTILLEKFITIRSSDEHDIFTKYVSVAKAIRNKQKISFKERFTEKETYTPIRMFLHENGEIKLTVKDHDNKIRTFSLKLINELEIQY